MTGQETLFGQALTDLYHGRLKGEFVVCDDTGRQHPLELEFYLSSHPDLHEIEALQSAQGKILDVGCGAGRILKWLQDQEADATGFDIDPLLVTLCRERGIKDVFVESYDNIARFALVDTILWMNRTICTAGSLTSIRALLRQCFSTCCDDGVLVFDSVEVRPELANVQPGVSRNTLRFKYGDEFDEPFDRAYFSSEIADAMLGETGWTIERTAWNQDIYVKVCQKKHLTAAKHRVQRTDARQ